jgi:hypothetical protein
MQSSCASNHFCHENAAQAADEKKTVITSLFLLFEKPSVPKKMCLSRTETNITGGTNVPREL